MIAAVEPIQGSGENAGSVLKMVPLKTRKILDFVSSDYHDVSAPREAFKA
jgi:hypothetical protein